MGRRRAQAIRQNPNSSLTALADTAMALGKALAKDLHTKYLYNPMDVIKRNDIDVVVICTPNNQHARLSIAALNSGKHVFCEKPLATTVEDARLMVNTANENRKFLKVSSNVRYFGNVAKGREMLTNGKIGEPLFFRGWIGHPGWNLRPGTWFMDLTIIGGGTLIDNGCHLIDIVRWSLGEIAECFGYTGLLKHKLKGQEDNAMAVLTTVDNKPAFIHSSWTEWNGYLYTELYGSEGSIIIDSRGDEAKVIVRFQDHDEIYDFSREPRESFKREIDDFIVSIKEGKEHPPTGYDGMRVVEIIHGIYESSKIGQRVMVAPQT